MPLFPITRRMPRSKRQVTPRNELTTYDPVCGFLKLPVEIRYQIYKLVFVARDVEIFWKRQRSKLLTHRTYEIVRADLDGTFPWAQTKDTPIPNMMFWAAKHLTLCNENNRHCLYDPLKVDTHPQLKQKMKSLGNQMALILACRTTYTESIALYYSLHSFGFTSRRVLERFLSTINPAAKAAITALYIQHGTYGDPGLTVDIPWKILHDSRWQTCCENMSNDLINLKELRIVFQVNDRPLKLNLTAEWVEPLLEFQKRHLTTFGLELLVQGETSSTDKRLKSCANIVRRTVLGEERYDAEDERRRQALRVLEKEKGISVKDCFAQYDPLVREVSL